MQPPNQESSVTAQPGDGASELVLCPKCGARVRRLKRHLRRVHARQSAEARVSKQSRTERGVAMRVPLPAIDAAPIAPTVRIVKTRPALSAEVLVEDWIRCADCGQGVLEGTLDVHRTARCATRISAAPQPRRESRFVRPAYLCSPEAGDNVGEDRTAHRHDATRGMHVYRDHGRFGSTPSYDGYGDEHTP